MSTPPSRSIITYPWTKKTMLFIFMMNLGKVRYIFVFITLHGLFLLGFGRVASRVIFLVIAKNNIMRMMDVILLYHIMRSEILHPEPPIINPTDNV